MQGFDAILYSGRTERCRFTIYFAISAYARPLRPRAMAVFDERLVARRG